MGSLAGYLWLLAIGGGRLVTAEEVLSQVAFAQRSLSSERGPGDEYMFDWEGDEIFHVDLAHREAVWRLPQFGEFAGFEAQGVPGDLATLHHNLGVYMSRTNNTPVQNVPPKVTIYPEKPVELGEPNVLICRADSFLPPVISFTWLKNGQEVKATEETDFYPNMDNSFHKFSYLTFVPNAEDIYYCRVEHWGLAHPLTKEWDTDMAEPLPETEANVVCGLGLAVGIVGIVVGTVFIIKNRQQNEANHRRGPI